MTHDIRFPRVRQDDDVALEGNGIDPSGLPLFLTLKEVARLLRRTERALFEWRRKRLLKVTKIGRAVFVRREEFLRLIDGDDQ